MSRDGSTGAYSLPQAAFVYNTVISETAVNSNFSDIATALSGSIAANGETTITGNLKMSGYKHTGVAAGTALTEYADVKSVQNGTYKYLGTAGGSKNALTFTPSPAITAYVAGQSFWGFIGSTSSDDAVTIAISGLSSPPAVEINGAACSATSQLIANKPYRFDFDGTAFQATRLSTTASISTALTRGYALAGNSSGVAAGVDISATGKALVGDGTDAVATGIIKQGVHIIGIPAGAMTPTTTNGCAAIAQVEGSNSHYSVLDFDASTDEHAFFTVPMPTSWNAGTVTFQVEWTSTATDTDGVAWALQGISTADGDALDTAYGTAVVVTDAAQSTSGDNYRTDYSGAVTIAGTPAAGELVRFRIFRDVSDAADTMAEDARLIAVRIKYTVNAADDT